MKTLALLSQKGGSGKSTLAVHLAVIAQATWRRTVLVDLDPQRSASGWWQARAAEHPEMVETTPGELRAMLKGAEADGVELCILDTRPSVEADAAEAAAVADLVLIPTRPAIFDMRAIGATVGIVEAAKAPAFLVLNACQPPRWGAEASATRDARRALEGYGVPLCPVSIALRTALAQALIDGRAVTEFDPDGRAAREMTALWAFTETELWPRPNARRSRR